MSDINHGFGMAPDGFRSASPDELSQVEGGLSLRGIVKFVKAVVQAVNDVLHPPGNPIAPIK